MKKLLVLAIAAAVFSATAEDNGGDTGARPQSDDAAEADKAANDYGWARRLSFSAFADVETAYICRLLARAMGGDMEIKSTLGKGTTFAIVVPNVKVVNANDTNVN